MEQSDVLKFRIMVQETNGGDIWYYPQVLRTFIEEIYLPPFISIFFVGKSKLKRTVWKWGSIVRFSSEGTWCTDESDYKHAYFSSKKEDALAAIESYKEYYYKYQNELKEEQQKLFNQKIKSETYIEV